MIGVLNLDMGNLRSVMNSVYQSGFDPVVVRGGDLDDLTHLIIPGVGHFGAAIAHVEKRSLRKPIQNFVMSGRPLLGSCLGMQLMLEHGEEGGDALGLGLIEGRVTRLNPDACQRIPHIGWNEVDFHRDHPLFDGIKSRRDFYFVHSYAAQCYNEGVVLGVTDYGGPVAAIIGQDNVIGFQFHPEKSQVNGLRLIENFCMWDGKC